MILSVVTFRNLSLRSAEFHFRSLSRPKGSPLPQIGHRFRNLKSKITKNFGARRRRARKIAGGSGSESEPESRFLRRYRCLIMSQCKDHACIDAVSAPVSRLTAHAPRRG